MNPLYYCNLSFRTIVYFPWTKNILWKRNDYNLVILRDVWVPLWGSMDKTNDINSMQHDISSTNYDLIEKLFAFPFSPKQWYFIKNNTTVYHIMIIYIWFNLRVCYHPPYSVRTRKLFWTILSSYHHRKCIPVIDIEKLYSIKFHIQQKKIIL